VSDWLAHGDAVLNRVEPTYPIEAKRRRLSGRVTVRILVNSEGEVDQVCGTGSHEILREAAENAAAQWRFRVPKLNGWSLPYVEGNLTFEFRLAGQSGSP
jgi:TonB family protein